MDEVQKEQREENTSKMRKRFTLGLACALACAASGCADHSKSAYKIAAEVVNPREMEDSDTRLEIVEKSGKLIIGISADYAPFGFTQEEDDKEEYIGSDIELGKYIAQELGVEAEFVNMDFNDCLAAVKEGDVDLALLGMLPEEGRLAYVDFTDAYYQPGEQVLLVEEGQSFASLDDLSEKTVAAQYGTLQAQLVVEQLPESYLELTDTVSDGIAMLAGGEADAVAVDKDLTDMLLKEYPELTVAKAAFDYSQEGVVGGVVEREPKLLEKINEIIGQVKEEGLYLQWMDAAMQQAAAQAKEASAAIPRASQGESDGASQAAGSD